MALMCRFFMRDLILFFGIWRWASFSMEWVWMAPLTPAVMVIRGLVFHPRSCIVLMSGSYLACL